MKDTLRTGEVVFDSYNFPDGVIKFNFYLNNFGDPVKGCDFLQKDRLAVVSNPLCLFALSSTTIVNLEKYPESLKLSLLIYVNNAK